MLRARLASALAAGAIAVIAVAAAIWVGGLWAGADRGAEASSAQTTQDSALTTRPVNVVSSPAPTSAAASASTPKSAPASVNALSDVDPAGQWRTILQDLYDLRASAFTTADPGPLAEVYAADSPQLATDTQAVQGLADAGQSLSGFDLVVESVEVVLVEADRAELRVVDSYGPFDVVAGEEVIAHDPGRKAATVSAVLARTTGGWRILSARLLT